MAEIEKIREIEKREVSREKSLERVKKETEKTGEGEERIMECPECGSRQLVHDYGPVPIMRTQGCAPLHSKP